MRFLSDIFLLTLSALLHALAFPSFLSDTGWGLLAFVSLIPMFIVINRSRWYKIGFQGFYFGFVFYLIYNFWLKTFHPLAILIAPILEGVQYIFLFAVLKLAYRICHRRGYLLQAVTFTAYSYLTQLGFLAFPYGNMASALYDFPILIQSCDIFGIWGIILLMIVPQTFIAQLIHERYKPLPHFRWDIVTYVSLFCLNLVYGFVQINRYDNMERDRNLRILAVQHNADSWENGYSTYRTNFESLKKMSLEGIDKYDPDMVLWSETAFVPSVRWHLEHPTSRTTTRLINDFLDFGKGLHIPLVTGNGEGVLDDPDGPVILDNGEFNRKDYNSVILFGDGTLLDSYRKQHLVPFTEYFPYQEEFPALTQLLIDNDYHWWEEGHEQTVFHYDNYSFSTPICFEDTFGYLSAQFVRNGADFLMNLSNDSWSHSIPSEVQHLSLAIFRTIENRRPMMRGTNSGITCLIDETGRMIKKLPPFETTYGCFDMDFNTDSDLTFYTRFPDILAKILLYGLPLWFVLALILNIRQKHLDLVKDLRDYCWYED